MVLLGSHCGTGLAWRDPNERFWAGNSATITNMRGAAAIFRMILNLHLRCPRAHKRARNGTACLDQRRIVKLQQGHLGGPEAARIPQPEARPPRFVIRPPAHA